MRKRPKPPVLSQFRAYSTLFLNSRQAYLNRRMEEEGGIDRGGHIAEAATAEGCKAVAQGQRDTDVKWYEDRIKSIFTDLEKLPLGISHHTRGLDHYDGEGNEVMKHQPDCLRCKYLRVKRRYTDVKEETI